MKQDFQTSIPILCPHYNHISSHNIPCSKFLGWIKLPCLFAHLKRLPSSPKRNTQRRDTFYRGGHCSSARRASKAKFSAMLQALLKSGMNVWVYGDLMGLTHWFFNKVLEKMNLDLLFLPLKMCGLHCFTQKWAGLYYFFGVVGRSRNVEGGTRGFWYLCSLSTPPTIARGTRGGGPSCYFCWPICSSEQVPLTEHMRHSYATQLWVKNPTISRRTSIP